jgi:hypothetical protein
VDVQLPHETLPVLLHGLDADVELGRRLLVGLALGDQLQANFSAGWQQPQPPAACLS